MIPKKSPLSVASHADILRRASRVPSPRDAHLRMFAGEATSPKSFQISGYYCINLPHADYAFFVVFRKSVDSVWHDGLPNKLLQINVGGCLL